MSSPLQPEPGRLNGWKEIALHLGKGTRTVQRWEKLYGLPVHRIGREGGEIVFAFRDEIDRWMTVTEGQFSGGGGDGAEGDAPASSEGEPATTPPTERELAPVRDSLPARGHVSRRRAALAAVALAAVLVLALWWAFGRSAQPPDRGPTRWRLANESLTVFDAAGAVLFEHRFGFALGGETSSDTWPKEHGPSPVLIADIDGDGRNEVLVRANALERTDRRLYCFEADGRTRFVHQPTGVRRFGDDEYAEPWVSYRTFLTRGPGGSRRLWAVFTHNLWFPAVLQELGPRGAVLQEYWSDGFIDFVTETVWNGRPVLLVGGTNNDFRGASLAIFSPDGVTGSAPAARPAYACRNCRGGGPEDFFIFPSLCSTRRTGQAGILEAWVEQGDKMRVTLVQGGPGGGASYYTLGPGGSLLGAEISREFQSEHVRLERQGLLDHPFGAVDDREMFPVRRWNGRQFVALGEVPVQH